MNIFRRKIVGLFFGVMLLTACGGGGGGGGGPTGLAIDSLAGNWSGGFVDSLTKIHLLSFAIDSAGNISNVLIDGKSSIDTGTITKTGDNTFGFRLTDGASGGLLADSAGNHMGILDDERSYGVLQKNAGSFPLYTSSDIGGTWSGYSVELDASLNVSKTYASSATVNGATYAFSGSNANGNFNGDFSWFAKDYGFWQGTWNSTQPSGGYVFAWMSPDKTFAATWACDYSSSSSASIHDVTGCSFSIWNK